MQVTLPEKALPAKLTLNPGLRMSDDDYFAFCMANPDVRFERTAEGEIVIAPPAGFESDHQSVAIAAQLYAWAERDGRGKVSGSSAEFILPTGAALSPGAAWVSNYRLAKLSKGQLQTFPPVCPEFVIEVMSPSDRLKAAQEKMQEWLRAGVELGWLIHARKRTIYVYRAGQKNPEALTGILRLAGEGPLAGFELDLTAVWGGLER